MTRRLAQLAALAGMVRDREVALLAARAADRRRAEAELTEIRSARARSIAAAAPDPAHLSGCAAAWMRLNAAQDRAAAQAAFRAAALAEEQAVRARRAFGRAQVLDKLARNGRR